MKVLHIINSLGTGGAEKLISQSLPLMEKQGVEVALLLLDGTPHPFLADLRARFDGPIYEKGKKSPYNVMHIFRIIPLLSRFDVVHVHLFPSMYWAAIAKWLSFSGTKLIFTEHNTHNRRREKVIFKILDKIVYSAYSAITTITEDALHSLKKHLGSGRKLSVIENGVDLEAIDTAVATPRNQIDRSLRESDFLVVMVAGFRAQKDHKTAIEAMSHLPAHVKLLLLGTGVTLDKNRALAKTLGLEDRVLFLGVRSNVPSILKAANVAILSSHWEGFGLAAVESMAAGIPFVASDVPGLSQVAGGAGLLFQKGDAAQLAGLIQDLISDPELYSATALACRKRSREFDIRSHVQSFITLYKQILN